MGLGGGINPTVEMFIPLDTSVEARYITVKHANHVNFPAIRIELFGTAMGNLFALYTRNMHHTLWHTRYISILASIKPFGAKIEMCSCS